VNQKWMEHAAIVESLELDPGIPTSENVQR
jgi:hypothetical protein